MANEIKIEARQNPSTMDTSVLVEFTVKFLEIASYDAMAVLLQEVAKGVAAKIFEEKKEEILAGVKIDLLVAEIEKILLEKIEAHAIKKDDTKTEVSNEQR